METARFGVGATCVSDRHHTTLKCAGFAQVAIESALNCNCLGAVSNPEREIRRAGRVFERLQRRTQEDRDEAAAEIAQQRAEAERNVNTVFTSQVRHAYEENTISDDQHDKQRSNRLPQMCTCALVSTDNGIVCKQDSEVQDILQPGKVPPSYSCLQWVQLCHDLFMASVMQRKIHMTALAETQQVLFVKKNSLEWGGNYFGKVEPRHGTTKQPQESREIELGT